MDVIEVALDPRTVTFSRRTLPYHNSRNGSDLIGDINSWESPRQFIRNETSFLLEIISRLNS